MSSSTETSGARRLRVYKQETSAVQCSAAEMLLNDELAVNGERLPRAVKRSVRQQASIASIVSNTVQ